MYKVSVAGKTMVGCNEDAWRTTSRIWFENARNSLEHGAAFTGSRQVGSSRTAPQSGMNERGLTFSRLVAYYPQQQNPFSKRSKITDEVTYLSDILHTCATVEEVKKYIERYDHSVFIDDVFIYVDSTGKYLIVEPYKLLEGNEPHYVLSNFCPSITDDKQARKQERFRNGDDFLKKHRPSASLAYCRSLSDTMHVCRNRNGDGTLLSSIWNTKDKLVNLYFYHSYDSSVQFKLSEELAKGDHLLSIPDLFPPNAEFERLANYRTPFNTPVLRILLVILSGILSFFALLFGIALIKGKNRGTAPKAFIALAGMNFLLSAYLFVLATNRPIFYFDAPYQHYSSKLITASSYLPFLLLLTIGPFTLFTRKQFKKHNTGLRTKTVLVANNLLYFLLILSFTYWGLYMVWR
jgi:hypothetical protein